MDLVEVILALVIGFFGLAWLFSRFRPSVRARRHRRNIRKARQLLDKLRNFSGDYRAARTLSYLRKINPYVFEELILECFKARGYQIVRNSRYSGDGGIDGQVIDASGNRYLIQAKRYAGTVRSKHLREFAQVVAQRKCRGIFIHTGRTPKISVNGYTGVQLVSGSSLVSLILNQ